MRSSKSGHPEFAEAKPYDRMRMLIYLVFLKLQSSPLQLILKAKENTLDPNLSPNKFK
jgi:hypothetical protein